MKFYFSKASIIFNFPTCDEPLTKLYHDISRPEEEERTERKKTNHPKERNSCFSFPKKKVSSKLAKTAKPLRIPEIIGGRTFIIRRNSWQRFHAGKKQARCVCCNRWLADIWKEGQPASRQKFLSRKTLEKTYAAGQRTLFFLSFFLPFFFPIRAKKAGARFFELRSAVRSEVR